MSMTSLRALGRRITKHLPSPRGRQAIEVVGPERNSSTSVGRRSRTMFAADTITGLVGEYALGDSLDRRICDLTTSASPQRVARDALRVVLAGHAEQEQIDDVVLVADELVGNAVKHTAGAVSFGLDRRANGIVVAVADDGDDVARLSAEPSASGDLAEDGRGMFIVDCLATAWSVGEFGAGKVVAALFLLRVGARR